MANTNDPSFIRSVQQALNDRGFNAGSADGVMGPHTEAALRKFQSANSLQTTGRLDSSTIAALGIPSRYESGSTGSASTGHSGTNTASAGNRSSANSSRNSAGSSMGSGPGSGINSSANSGSSSSGASGSGSRGG